MANKIVRSVRQQYENYLAVYKGALESQRLSVTTAVDPSDSNNAKIVRGSVVSLNSNGRFVIGCPNPSGTIYPMPMFSKKNIYDPDVMTGAKGETTGEALADSTVGGTITAYVATGAFELETSEFDRTASYSYNQALVAGTGDIIGKVTPISGADKVYTTAKTVVGIVSALPVRGKDSMNVNGTAANRLRFWPVFFPGKIS